MKIIKVERIGNNLLLYVDSGMKLKQKLNVFPEKNKSANPHDQEFWESLCHGCGDCCYYRWQEGSRVISTDEHCVHFDPETRRCKDYANRENIIEGCSRMTPDRMPSGMPEYCGYVKFLAQVGK